MEPQAVQAYQGAIISTRRRDFDLVPFPVEALPPKEEVGFHIEGTPELAMRVLWTSEDRCKAITVERLGPCKLIPYEQEGVTFFNLFYLMEGRCRQLRADGTTDEWKAGDYVGFTQGQYVESTVIETFVKCAYYSYSRPLPFEVTP